jgi:hypothetical protein
MYACVCCMYACVSVWHTCVCVCLYVCVCVCWRPSQLNRENLEHREYYKYVCMRACTYVREDTCVCDVCVCDVCVCDVRVYGVCVIVSFDLATRSLEHLRFMQFTSCVCVCVYMFCKKWLATSSPDKECLSLSIKSLCLTSYNLYACAHTPTHIYLYV